MKMKFAGYVELKIKKSIRIKKYGIYSREKIPYFFHN
jgi:hypothetical protein